MCKKFLVLIATALFAGSVLAGSPIYKWVDKDGHVHYSTVPHNANAKPINVQNSAEGMAPSPGTVAGSAAADNQMPQVSGDDSPACKAAKQRLSQYMSSDALYTKTPDGKQKQLTKDEQSKVLQRARNDVTVACAKSESPQS